MKIWVKRPAWLAGVVLLAVAGEASAQRGATYAYALPIAGGGCSGFCESNGAMYLFEYEGRRLYEVSPAGKLVAREEVPGWFVVDATVIGGKAIYCSRDRVFRKERGKVEVNPVPRSTKLVSIAADDKEVFLLDAATEPQIFVLNQRSGKEVRRLKYDGRNPVDLVVGEGQLWILDQGDRSIRRVDKQSGNTTLRLQAGPGVEGTSRGLLFRDGQLYVHEGDFSRLRRVDWKAEGTAVWSWSRAVRMTFVQESRNEHEKDTSVVSFRVPIPPDRATQTVGEVAWSQPPAKVTKDRYGQAIAVFEGVRIAPKSEHVLSYTVDLQARAVQYDLPKVPLEALDAIDDDIRRAYLADNALYRLSEAAVRAAAREARKGPQGDEPTDVRMLIENIAENVCRRLSYRLDDTWKDAATVVAGDAGSCSEYSFLFSALCRLNKVPTRLVGGVEIDDYATPHETKGFHRWTEVWFPEIGWVPVDVTKIDGAEGSADYEFLFGTPGYMLVLSEGDYDEQALGMTYAIWRDYRGGRRERENYVRMEPIRTEDHDEFVRLSK